MLRTDWFREKVRARLVAEVERASGGRTEIGAFHYDWSSLTFRVEPFVVHGTEGPNEAPLFACDRLAVQLKLISAWRRDVDLQSVTVDKPRLNFQVYPDGRTNLPAPKVPRKPSGDPVEQLLKLAIGRLEVRDGVLRVGDEGIPLDAVAEGFQARLDYHFNGPRYRGTLSSSALRTRLPGVQPLALQFSADVSLLRDRVEFPRLELATGDSRIQGSNGVLHLRPASASMDVKGHARLADFVKQPGEADFTGKALWRGGKDYRIEARFDARGYAIERIANIAGRGEVTLEPSGLTARGLDIAVFGGRFRGNGEWREWREFAVKGDVAGFSVADLNRVQKEVRVTYTGTVSGPVEVRGEVQQGALRNVVAATRAEIAPAGANPIRGTVGLTWEQRKAVLRLEQSRVELPNSTVEVAGTLGERLAVRAESRNLEDALPAIAMFGETAFELPAKLGANGWARFTGEVLGPLASPRIRGSAAAAHVVYQGRTLARVEADVDLSATRLAAKNVTLAQGPAILTGAASVEARGWRVYDRSAVQGQMEAKRVSLTQLDPQSPVKGTVEATARVTGTVGSPEGTARVTIEKPVGFGEAFDRGRADVRFAGPYLEVVDGRLEQGAARFSFSGVYRHATGDWTSGDARFSGSGTGFTLEALRNVQQARAGVGGKASARAVGTATWKKGDFFLTNLNGQVTLRDLTLDKRPLGNLQLDAKTNGVVLDLTAAGDLRGAKISGSGEWRLQGAYPGRGQAKLAPVDFRTLIDLASAAGIESASAPPIDGLIEANFNFTGPARDPDRLTARLEIPRVLVRASDTRTRTVQEIQDLTLRNTEPVIVDYENGTARVKSAKFTGKDTNLSIDGAIAVKDKAQWDLRAKGNLNLAALRDFVPDLEASGKAALDAQVRGALNHPQLSGSLQLSDVAANFRGVPTGIDKGSGVIQFQNNRAVIQKLTAEVGGGRLTFSGFVGYTAGQAAYRLQGNADDVRVRMEGVSVTVNSTLNLSGSTAASLLTGSLTVRKAGFTPKTDLGGLLAEYAKPIQTPSAPNETLRNMQLDVHIETAPGLMFQTALTKDIQAEADLRLRGTAARPSVLGRVGVNQGEINFFGTNYLINRGDILFLNPTKIEPVLDLDLQTQARGVIVTINFNGTLQKMNVSYRSDPPLQSSEIIALLTVGRAPGSNPALASSQVASSQSLFATGANTILGQAVSAPVSSRLQRFFGVSRLKIDPLLTDVTSVPQARLTLEQQISKDVTLTYITNLNKTQEQIVRLQWDLNRRWSLIAVRDENGLFGIDFQYRRRFK